MASKVLGVSGLAGLERQAALADVGFESQKARLRCPAHWTATREADRQSLKKQAHWKDSLGRT